MKYLMNFVLAFVAISIMPSCQKRGMITKKVAEVKVTERKVNYRDVAVPEEGGIRFTKFTEENEKVMGPYIRLNKGVIEWYTPSLITVSPDDSQVAYTALKDGKTNIFIKNTKGGKTTIQRTFRENILDMSYSPDGKYIVFTEKADNDYNILQIHATQGAAIQHIAASSARESSPVYETNASLVFFTQGEYVTSSNDYRYYIWSIDPKTFLKTQYSEGFNPAVVNKNSSLLVVCRNNKANGYGEIYSIDLISGQETMILSHPEMGFSSPKVSPDGKTIVCVGTTIGTKDRKENLDIYTVKMDGTNLTQLTFHPGHDVSPVWGNNGKEIYFLCQRGNDDGSWGVWKMDYLNR